MLYYNIKSEEIKEQFYMNNDIGINASSSGITKEQSFT